MYLICVVEEIFDLQNQGCVIAPGIPVDFQYPIARGARLIIETPSGGRMATCIIDILLLKQTAPLIHTPFSLQPGIRKVDVPRGSKVFLVL